MGAPKKPEAKKLKNIIVIRVTDPENTILRKRAKATDVALSQFIRDVLMGTKSTSAKPAVKKATKKTAKSVSKPTAKKTAKPTPKKATKKAKRAAKNGVESQPLPPEMPEPAMEASL